jgi:hypothetical protein
MPIRTIEVINRRKVPAKNKNGLIPDKAKDKKSLYAFSSLTKKVF